MNCDPNSLASAAKCFQCLPNSIIGAIKTYLMCQWQNAAGNAQNFGLEWTPAALDIASVIGFSAFNLLPNSLVGVTSITFPQTTTQEGVDIERANDLVTVNFPNLVSVTAGGYLTVFNCPNCTTISAPNLSHVDNGQTWNFGMCALPSSFVNFILAVWVSNPLVVSSTLVFNGGTNGPPTGQGIADKSTLIGRGCSITTN